MYLLAAESLVDIVSAAALVWGSRFGVSLLVFFAFWLAALLIRGFIKRLGAARSIDANITRFLARAIHSVLMVVGGITALGTLGIDVSALVAGLGLTGFAVGFALKDIISNTLSGILIIIYQPFKTHDTIKVTAFEGEVIEIDLRYTHLQTGGQKIFVPNSLLLSNAVTVQAVTVQSQALPSG